MDIQIKEYVYGSRCDINRCSEKAKFSIGVQGGPSYNNFNMCDKHLKQVIEKGVELYDGINISGSEGNNAELESLTKELASKNAIIALLKEKIAELTNNVPKIHKPNNTPVKKKTGSGKKGRK
jgi:hypothetical protein